ncbi:peptidase C14 caspase catalytic subunit p20 [Rhizobium sp. CF080]|nr:peptidase C14 caspase catalytic subunit p20 [Rhizobium sp. CF080]
MLIGIDKAKSLNPLKAAVSGAKSMESWLALDGYETSLITDEHGDVAIGDLKREVRRLVQSAEFEKLVIYFAGHGLMSGSNEIWLLSNAIDDADEVIDVGRSAEDSRRGEIGSVIFISDACRTVPQTLAQSRMTGGTLFPNGDGRLDVEVDRFFATRPGDAALEVAISEGQSSVVEKYVGVFTEALRSIHIDPARELIGSADVDGTEGPVVLSRRLKRVLPNLVNERVQDVKLSLRQQPQLRLECGDDGFVAKPIFTKGLRRDDKKRPQPPDPILEKRFEAAEANVLGDRSEFETELFLQDDSDRPRFEAYRQKFALLDGRLTEPMRPGATIIGRPVKSIWSYRFAELDARSSGDAVINLNGRAVHPVSVIVRFEDNTGAVLALLPNYHLTVKLDESGILQMTYSSIDPDSGENFRTFDSNEIWILRAQAAAAINIGLFPMDRHQVIEFADAIRRWKKVDPTLGLYAAIGYAEVGLKSQINSVLRFMDHDIKGSLLDLLILSGSRRRGRSVAPFCPMLSQTWAYLDNASIACPQKILEAGRHRQQSPWTTFTPDGMRILREAYKLGELNWVNR